MNMAKGWKLEPGRHALAAKGVKTGNFTNTLPIPHKELMQMTSERQEIKEGIRRSKLQLDQIRADISGVKEDISRQKEDLDDIDDDLILARHDLKQAQDKLIDAEDANEEDLAKHEAFDAKKGIDQLKDRKSDIKYKLDELEDALEDLKQKGIGLADDIGYSYSDLEWTPTEAQRKREQK